MPFSGGTFTRVHDWTTDEAAVVPITASRMDAEMNGIATGLSTILTKDGQSLPSAAIPFNGQKITGLGNATADGDMLNRITADGRYYNQHGQCYLMYTSTTSIALVPYDGNKIVIGGVRREIPIAGASLTCVAAGGFYYVYAYMVGSTITLELSATGATYDSTTGVAIKSGDSSRTLVGAVYMPSANTLYNETLGANISVLSWFNRRPKRVTGNNSGVTTTSSTYVALGAACVVPNWDGEAVVYRQTGYMFHYNPGAIAYCAPAVDGSVSPSYGVQGTSAVGTYLHNASWSYSIRSAGGAHTYHSYGAAGATGPAPAAYWAVIFAITTMG